jgi:hypothetical protein
MKTTEAVVGWKRRESQRRLRESSEKDKPLVLQTNPTATMIALIRS